MNRRSFTRSCWSAGDLFKSAAIYPSLPSVWYRENCQNLEINSGSSRVKQDGSRKDIHHQVEFPGSADCAVWDISHKEFAGIPSTNIAAPRPQSACTSSTDRLSFIFKDQRCGCVVLDSVLGDTDHLCLMAMHEKF
ncbi:hypothetical protein WG66_004011 [Moniliophthora roreri]|nr:hypothetical protein WG66_004011 [Moniliophthora roreri]